MIRLIFIFAFLLLPACATVNNSTGDHFRIDSVPQGAKVVTTLEVSSSQKQRNSKNYVPQYHGCEPTPCAIPVNRRSRFIATVTHPEYETAEIFIGNSSRKGSFAGTMAATTAGVGATTAVSATTAAATLAVSAQVTSIILSGVANSLTFGAVPVSSAAIPTASTSTLMAAAVPPALIVSGSMLLVDAASGANKNLFPNPVVLGLAPKGQPTKIDPFAILYREELALVDRVDTLCANPQKRGTQQDDDCRDAKRAVTSIRKKQKDVMKLIEKAQKEAAIAAKAEAKAAKAKEGTAPTER